ncbi:right-handed parallel beta-helix repeat-containing protein [Nocardioides dongxiaopingii]|uniref:right-handed parallel beta-helix repeat-containing protein n=1 Tax=Nocardioides dongxiaopingii TaxID=2576036 RepID=UPI0010C764C1|nr:right-handed parallel beta-helix repeat-containing protein [Nocardioides dongxiaopingii]
MLFTTPHPHGAESGPSRLSRSRGTCLAVALGVVSALVSVPPVDAATTAGSAVGRAATPTLHVAVRGQDGAAGTEARPLRTIAAAVARAVPGQKIVIHPGRYHETVEVPGDKPGVSLVAARRGSVTMDGARPVTGFVRSGDVWVRAGWDAEFDHSPTYTFGAPDSSAEYWSFINRAHPMAAHPDQVWFDGRELRQVASPGQVSGGTFYVDDAGDRLVVGSDPSGRRVEASRLVRALEIRAEDVTVDGIDVVRYAPSVPHMGAVTAERDGIRIEHARIQDNATTGLHVMARGIVVRDVTLADNGMMGMTSNGASDLRLVEVVARHNNTEHFNHAPAAGGVKITRSRGVTVTRSRFNDNIGTGLWFDESAYDVEVTRSRFLRNQEHGLRFEISGRAVAAGNLVVDNRVDGINVNNTDHVQLWNNTVTGGARPINIVQDTRDVDPGGSWRDPTLPLTWRNSPVQVRNNILTGTGATGGCLLCVEDYSRRWSGAEMRISAAGNLYHRSTGSGLVYWPGARGATLAFASIPAFRAATGQESTGRSVGRSPLRIRSAADRRWIRGLQRRVAVRVSPPIARLLDVRAGRRLLGAR